MGIRRVLQQVTLPSFGMMCSNSQFIRSEVYTLKFSPDLKAKINKPDQEDKSASNANKVEERGKLEGWIPKNYQAASVGNRDLEQLLEKALQGIQQNTQAIARKTRRQLKQFRTLRNPSGEVVNLSNKLFTHHEFKLLNKGLSFCPTPQQHNRLNFNKDLQSFFRRFKLRAYTLD